MKSHVLSIKQHTPTTTRTDLRGEVTVWSISLFLSYVSSNFQGVDIEIPTSSEITCPKHQAAYADY